MSDEKIVGFRVPKEDESRLKKDLYYRDITKKEWLAKQLTINENIAELSNKKNERWLRVPASEYEHFHGMDPGHHNIIYDRIYQHCFDEGVSITFDNLMQDVNLFFKMNDIQITRFDDNDIEIIHIDHDIGKHYSKFLKNMILKMIKSTSEYTLSNVEVHDTKLTIKILKK